MKRLKCDNCGGMGIGSFKACVLCGWVPGTPKFRKENDGRDDSDKGMRGVSVSDGGVGGVDREREFGRDQGDVPVRVGGDVLIDESRKGEAYRTVHAEYQRGWRDKNRERFNAYQSRYKRWLRAGKPGEFKAWKEK